MLERQNAAETQGSGLETVVDVVETSRGVLAIATRGRVTGQVRGLLKDDALDATFQLGTPGDVALALREERQLVVRVVGRAAILVRRTDGRSIWVESGMARYPGDSVVDQLLLVGIPLDDELKAILESWLATSDRSPERLRELAPDHLADAVGLIGHDVQRAPLEAVVQQGDADGLLDLLVSVSDWDDRATPDVVRRAVGPVYEESLSAPRNLGAGFFEAEPVSTPMDSGPPFRPVLLVDPFWAPTPGPTLSPFSDTFSPFRDTSAPFEREDPPASSDRASAPTPATEEREAAPTPATEERVSTPPRGSVPVAPVSAAPASVAPVEEPTVEDPRSPSRTPDEEPTATRDEVLPQEFEPEPDTPNPYEFSIDPVDERLVKALDLDRPTPVEPVRRMEIPLWAGALFGAFIVGMAFVASWVFLLLL